MEGLRERRIQANGERDAMRKELEAVVAYAQRVEEAATGSQRPTPIRYCSDGWVSPATEGPPTRRMLGVTLLRHALRYGLNDRHKAHELRLRVVHRKAQTYESRKQRVGVVGTERA